MRYPTATAAAAAETCRKERRERQAGFSSIDMILPPDCDAHILEKTRHKLSRSPVPTSPFSIEFLAGEYLSEPIVLRAFLQKRQGRKGEGTRHYLPLKQANVFTCNRLRGLPGILRPRQSVHVHAFAR